MNIVFRVDSSNIIGSGHVMRCLSLADELKFRKNSVLFICNNEDGNLNNIIKKKGYQVIEIASENSSIKNHALIDQSRNTVINNDAHQTKLIIKDKKVDWLIVDHYFLDENWESELKKYVNAIFVIDDLANRRHDCDLLLDQNWFGIETKHRYDEYTNESTISLLGPNYAILSKDFRSIKKNKRKHNGFINQILIFMGAVDSKRQTREALLALCNEDLSNISVDVVIGSSNKDKDQIINIASNRKKTKIYNVVPSLSELMQKADLILCAGGSTTWERCFMGLPAIVFIASENQNKLTRQLAKDNAHILLESSTQINSQDWYLNISELVKDNVKLRKMSAIGENFVDGRGSYRILSHLYGFSMPIEIRKATIDDEKLLFEWVNEPTVRKFSFSSKDITNEDHKDWLRLKLNDPNCLILIGTDSNTIPIGQVRIESINYKNYIDISIDKEARGLGFAQILIEESVKFWRNARINSWPLIAEVLFTNKASQQVFINSGFVKCSSENDENFIRFKLN